MKNLIPSSVLWRTRKGFSLLRIARKRLRLLFWAELKLYWRYFVSNILNRKGIAGPKITDAPIYINLKPKYHVYQDSISKPTIFASACESKHKGGGNKYNGGIKALNEIVNLLLSKGYDAYMVTYDGTYQPWLIEHAPHISLNEFQKMVQDEVNHRYLTSWIFADSFISSIPRFYFWDMELAYTSQKHFFKLNKYLSDKITRIATCNRYMSGWYMSNFEIDTHYLPLFINEKNWISNNNRRMTQRVGYMGEHPETDEEIEIIRRITKKNNLNLDFYPIYGTEEECVKKMQTCNVFLGMNHGKDILWGEGFGLPMFESLWSNCIVISYDILGNREYLIDNFNGFLVPSGNFKEMARKLIDLFASPETFNSIRSNNLIYMNSAHTSNSRWLSIKSFLNLTE